jgi:hypothetical protein
MTLTCGLSLASFLAAAEGRQGTAGTNIVTYTGCCDASAGVALTTNLFVVGDDEDSVLRVYRRDVGGPPVQLIDMTRFLAVDPKKPESDLEAATILGDRIYWITSHGQNRFGKTRESRHRLFATSVITIGNHVDLKPVGRPYHFLLEDMEIDPRLRQFNLLAASTLPPKAPGGLNIEAICGTDDGRLLIGFRNPTPGGKALLVPLLNPGQVIQGHAAKFGDPILLDLGGQGFRDMTCRGSRYLIVAGARDTQYSSHLYVWDGVATKPTLVENVHFKNFNPEALFFYPNSPLDEFQLLSDDGTLNMGGIPCKALPDPQLRRFRSIVLNF